MESLAELEGFNDRELAQAVARLRAGGSLAEFEEAIIEHLQEAHTRGVVIGRHWAGDMAARELDDELFAGRVVEGQLKFLSGFIQDIEDGRYSLEGGYTSGLDNRLKMYGDRVGGTMSEVFVLASPEDDSFTWHMLADEHCDDCPRWAAGGPYTAKTLPAHPRDGTSACKMGCRCVVVRKSDGTPSPPPFGLGI